MWKKLEMQRQSKGSGKEKGVCTILHRIALHGVKVKPTKSQLLLTVHYTPCTKGLPFSSESRGTSHSHKQEHSEAAVSVDQIVHPYMSEAPQNTMEGRARRRASPAGMRTRPIRVEPEPPPPTKRHEQGTPTRVAVVYYLCRNHQLEHPHFMEVPLASPQGLYLRDVINRLDALRGKGMAAKYSWSCKRRYKHGFVWHDLSEGDLLLPAQGAAEYVLKGSELHLDQSTPDHGQNNGTSSAKVQLPTPSPQQESPAAAAAAADPIMKEAVPPSPCSSPPAVSAIKDAALEPALRSSPFASTIGYDERCRMPRSGSSSDSSPKTSMSSSGASSPGLNNPTAAHDAATQTDDNARGASSKPQQGQVAAGVTPERPEIIDEFRSTRRPAGEHPYSRRSGTLQSLIRAEAAGRRRGAPEEEDERTAATKTGSISGRLKPANLLMRLMACGPNHPGIGPAQTSYKPRFRRLEYLSSPELSPLAALEPGTAGASTVTVRGSETENYSGGLHDSGAGKLPSSSRSHQDGVHDGARSSKGDSVV